MSAYRQLKKRIQSILLEPDIKSVISAVKGFPARQVINPLLGSLYHSDPLIRWRAVTAIGQVVSQLAMTHMESARVVMRRLMWMLNDESGGIGWGSPEAMGEIMACHQQLRHEYAHILVSYLNPKGNYLEHEGLQKGALWAIGRVARVDSNCVSAALPFIISFLTSSDSSLRGLALWSGAPMADASFWAKARILESDLNDVELYDKGSLMQCTLSELLSKLVAH
ncbi:MAG: HEAT repeat domain-containing protein [Desulfobacteraceae bacterium]|nr:HEAT repeat domain-containing protein [Desulfobacteraceae bacterium]